MDNKTPNEILSDQIVSKLIEDKLILETDKDEITKAIANGTIKDTDWKVYFETLLSSNQKEEEHED